MIMHHNVAQPEVPRAQWLFRRDGSVHGNSLWCATSLRNQPRQILAAPRWGQRPLNGSGNIFEQISILHTSIGKHREDCAMCRSVDAAVHEGMQISRPLNHIQ